MIRYSNRITTPPNRLRHMMRLFSNAAALTGVFLLVFSPVTAHGEPVDRDVLAEINLARTKPATYLGFLREFRARFDGNDYRPAGATTRVRTQEGVRAVDEAIAAFSRQKPLPPLRWSDGLAAAAAELASAQQESGATGHGTGNNNLPARIERHGTWRGEIGENIGYGPADARMMILQLLVDDGVPDRGHRDNIFRRKFETAGVACGHHPTFRTLCVIDFASSFKEPVGKKGPSGP